MRNLPPCQGRWILLIIPGGFIAAVPLRGGAGLPRRSAGGAAGPEGTRRGKLKGEE